MKRKKGSSFKVGCRVSVKHKQLVGRSDRPSYAYGTIVERPPDRAHLPLSGGFHYVQLDGSGFVELAHVSDLTHILEVS